MSHIASAPPRTRPSYTPESARRALPLLRAIVRDAHDAYVRLRTGLAAHDDLIRLVDLSSEDELPEGLRGVLAELHEHIGELRELGARLLDPELGVTIVDGEIEGRPAHLCWKLGEETFQYWMPIGAGYDQRRPIPDA